MPQLTEENNKHFNKSLHRYNKIYSLFRYYYKSQVLLPVFGRRLVYKFGPNATGWRPILHPSQVI